MPDAIEINAGSQGEITEPNIFVHRLMYAKCNFGSMTHPLNVAEVAGGHGVLFGPEEQPVLNANDWRPGVNVIHFGDCSPKAVDADGNVVEDTSTGIVKFFKDLWAFITTKKCTSKKNPPKPSKTNGSSPSKPVRPKVHKTHKTRKEKAVIKMPKDTQSNKYQLTINNPLDYGYTHEKIFETCRDNFKTLQYLCMADEQGSTFHTHIFVCFSSRVRFSKVKKHFPEAHIEKCRGTASDNVNYIKKSGKWENDRKHGTKIEGSFEEYGSRPPDSRGKRGDMTELYQMVADGMTSAEILSENQDYILHLDKIERLRTTLLTERYKDNLRIDMEVIYRFGETGTKKTSGTLMEYGCENVYRVTNYKFPFDNYNCQPVICFE